MSERKQDYMVENESGFALIDNGHSYSQLLHQFQESFPSRNEVIEGSSLGNNFDHEKSDLHSSAISPQMCNQNMWNGKVAENWEINKREMKNGIYETEKSCDVLASDGDGMQTEKWRRDGREKIENMTKNKQGTSDAHEVFDDDLNNNVQNENCERNGCGEMKNEKEKDKNKITKASKDDGDFDSEELSSDLGKNDEKLSVEVEKTLEINQKLHIMQTRNNSPKRRKYVENEDGDISGRYLCYVCGKTYAQVSHLSRHTKSSHTKESFLQCTICDTTFTRAESLIRHLKLHEQRHGASASKGPFKCPLCSKTYQQQYNVARHLLTHSGKKPYQCPECYKTFTQHTGLTRHLIIHKGSRDFKCDVCGKAFARQFVLSRHKLTHTEDKPYKCFVCNKSYIRGSQLECHMKVHKGGSGQEDKVK